jgi:two-component system, OmpR family, response regulator CpxR
MSQLANILVVEDEAHLAQGLLFNLRAEGYTVQLAGDGETALDMIASDSIDAVILDVMLPGRDGFSVAAELRAQQNFVPILMLTARSRPEDVLNGFGAGADDYLPKPFGTEELMARIRAVLRRAGRAHKEAEVLEAGEIKLIPSARQVSADGTAVAVTTVEYDILEFLVHSAGRIVSRDELTSALYRRRATKFDRTLDMHICNLRKKLGRHGDLIRTVRGVGYLCRIEPDGPGET